MKNVLYVEINEYIAKSIHNSINCQIEIPKMGQSGAYVYTRSSTISSSQENQGTIGTALELVNAVQQKTAVKYSFKYSKICFMRIPLCIKTFASLAHFAKKAV